MSHGFILGALGVLLMVEGCALGAAGPQADKKEKVEKKKISGKSAFHYPVARKDGTVEDYHGTKVADPYRWLENPDSPEARAWIEAENKITFGFLNSIPERK